MNQDDPPHDHESHSAPEFQARVERAAGDWLDTNDPLSRAEFDTINSAFVRNVGEAGELPDGRVNKHFRVADAEAVGLFSHHHDVPIIEIGDDVGYVDIHGFALEDGIVPVLVCLPDGDVEVAAQTQHDLYHDIDEISPGGRAVTDGGETVPESHDEIDWSGVGRDVFPPAVTHYDAWLPWLSGSGDNKKIPTAEHYTDLDDPFSWSDPGTLTDFDTAKQWADMVPGLEGVIYIIQDDNEDGKHAGFADPFLLVDYDDARDPETGEISDYATTVMDMLGSTYTDISHSWGGLHQIFEGSLPEGVTTLAFEFPDGSGVEIYEGKRPCAFTGRWVTDTPREVREVDQNALSLLCMFHGNFSGGSEGDAWDPGTSREELADMNQVDNMDQVVDAIKQVRPGDIRLKSKKTGQRSNGTLDFDPSWEYSESGTRLGWDPDIGWIYRRGSIGLDAIQVVALEEGITHSVTDYPEGKDWVDAVTELRSRGAHIPVLDNSDGDGGGYAGKSEGHEWDPEWVTSIPLSRRAHAIASGWNWASAGEPLISTDEVYERVERHLDSNMGRGEYAILDSPMSSGKTYSSFKIAAERGEPMTYLTARRDLYEQARGYSEEHALDHYTLPSVHHDCPTFTGEHGDGWEHRVKEAYRNGATPDEIHDHWDLPCQNGDGCPYKLRWQFDADQFDVLIGHFSHAHINQVIAGRHVVIDEYPGDALREEMPSAQLESAVPAFLDRYDDFPAEDYVDLLARRDDDGFEREVRQWFAGYEWEPDSEGVFHYDDYHALTPHAVYTIATAEAAGSANSGYPFEFSRLPNSDRHTGVFERGNRTAVHLQVPPREWSYARSLTALDGTPDPDMWENALGIRLNHRETFTSIEEERDYYQDTLGISIYRTSGHVKPYSSGEFVTEPKDRSVAAQVSQDVDEPVVVSSLKAIDQYEEAGWLEDDGPAKALDNFQNLRGSNRYADEDCALITGSTHYGHEWVQREAAFQNADVYPEGKGNDQEFGSAEDIAYQMREAVILQTILRFGRGTGNGAVVFLHSNLVPDEVEVEGTAANIRVNTEHQKAIFNVCTDMAERQDAISPVEVFDHPSVECTKRTVEKTMRRFCEDGIFDAKDRDGRRVVYTGWDGEAHHMTPDGEVTLPSVDVGDDSEGGHNIDYVPRFGVSPPERPPATTKGDDDPEVARALGDDHPPGDPPPG